MKRPTYLLVAIAMASLAAFAAPQASAHPCDKYAVYDHPQPNPHNPGHDTACLHLPPAPYVAQSGEGSAAFKLEWPHTGINAPAPVDIAYCTGHPGIQVWEYTSTGGRFHRLSSNLVGDYDSDAHRLRGGTVVLEWVNGDPDDARKLRASNANRVGTNLSDGGMVAFVWRSHKAYAIWVNTSPRFEGGWVGGWIERAVPTSWSVTCGKLLPETITSESLPSTERE